MSLQFILTHFVLTTAITTFFILLIITIIIIIIEFISPVTYQRERQRGVAVFSTQNIFAVLFLNMLLYE